MDTSWRDLRGPLLGNSPEEDVEQVVCADPEPKLYLTRFYVLWVHCVMMLMYVVLGIGYAPISYPIGNYYGISEVEVTWVVNWSALIYLPSLPVCSMILTGRTKALRLVSLVASSAMFLGATLRVAPLIFNMLQLDVSGWAFAETLCIHAGAILNALAGPCLWSTAPLMAATWFGAGERTTATGIISSANSMGAMLVFALLPNTILNAGDVPAMQWVMWGASAIVFLQVVLYLPAAPPTPPCAVRHVEASLGLHVKRTDSNSVICQMREVSSSYQSVLLNRSCCCLQLACGFTIGCFFSWQNMVDLLLGDNAQKEASLINTNATVAGLVGALVAGPLADAWFKRRLKLLLVLAMSCSCVAMTMFVLTLPPLEMKPLLPAWVRDPLIVVVGAACGLALPVSLELGVELTHPLGAAASSSVFTGMLQGGQMIFLMICPIVLNKPWWSPALAIVILVSVFLLLAIKEEYKRTPKPPAFVPVLHQSAQPLLTAPCHRPDAQPHRDVMYNSHFQFGSYDASISNAAPQAIRQQIPLNTYEVIRSPGPAWWWKTPKIFGQPVAPGRLVRPQISTPLGLSGLARNSIDEARDDIDNSEDSSIRSFSTISEDQ